MFYIYSFLSNTHARDRFSSFLNIIAIALRAKSQKIKRSYLCDFFASINVQLESLKGDGALKEPEASLTEIEEVSSAEVDNVETKMENAGEVDGGSSVEEIVKELKEVKRQNFVTHCLLSALIVLTVAWQVSEVSLIWKLKNGFSRPFRSFGSAFSWILKGPDANGTQDAEKQFAAAKQRLTEAAASLPSVVIPEIPLMDFPDLVLEGENQ